MRGYTMRYREIPKLIPRGEAELYKIHKPRGISRSRVVQPYYTTKKNNGQNKDFCPKQAKINTVSIRELAKFHRSCENVDEGVI